MADAPPARRSPGHELPRALLVAVAAVGVEVLALAGVVVFYAVELLGGAPVAQLGGATATAVLAAGLAAFLVVAARALLARRRWARAPLITWQLFQVVVTAPLGATPLWPVAVGFIGLAVVAATCLVRRSVAEAVEDDGAPPVH